MSHLISCTTRVTANNPAIEFVTVNLFDACVNYLNNMLFNNSIVTVRYQSFTW